MLFSLSFKLLQVNSFKSALVLAILCSLSATASQVIQWNPVEKQFLQNNPVIKYCVDPDWLPFEAIVGGNHVGLSSDYVKLFENSSGMKFELVKTESWEQTLYFLKQNRCDIVSFINKTPDRAKFLLFTIPYFRDANVIITRDNIRRVMNLDSLSGKNLGIVKSYMQHEFIQKNYPEINIVPLENELNGLKRVSSGELDASISSLLSFSKHMRENDFVNLKISGKSLKDDELRVGIVRSKEPLVPILNKLINNISEKQYVEIYRKWNKVEFERNKDYSWLWQAFLITSFIMLFFLERYLSLRKLSNRLRGQRNHLDKLRVELEQRNQQLEYLSIHDELTKLKNRKAINEQLKAETKEVKRYHKLLSMILIDIDDFKKFNDLYGHQFGDEVLVGVASVLANTVRETDFLGRWGGEEFIVICPSTDVKQAEELAQRIVKALSAKALNKDQFVTCSFGVSQFESGETIDRWFERTDLALYKAKELGKNLICLSE